MKQAILRKASKQATPKAKAPFEKISISLPPSMILWLDRASASQHRTRSGHLQFLVSQHMARTQTQK